MNAKASLFGKVLDQLKQRAYFKSAEVAPLAREFGLDLSPGTLRVYLSEATASGLIHDAGRGWYSSLSKPVPIDPKPVTRLIRAIEKAFPLLEFTVWSTAQINPWMHHLLAQPVAFLHAAADALESIGDTLRAQGWEVAVNPPPSVGPQAIRPGEKMVVLRPALAKQPSGKGRQAAIEKILVDLVTEASRLALMESSEAERVCEKIMEIYLLQIGELKRYAYVRRVDIKALESIN